KSGIDDPRLQTMQRLLLGIVKKNKNKLVKSVMSRQLEHPINLDIKPSIRMIEVSEDYCMMGSSDKLFVIEPNLHHLNIKFAAITDDKMTREELEECLNNILARYSAKLKDEPKPLLAILPVLV